MFKSLKESILFVATVTIDAIAKNPQKVLLLYKMLGTMTYSKLTGVRRHDKRFSTEKTFNIYLILHLNTFTSIMKK